MSSKRYIPGLSQDNYKKCRNNFSKAELKNSADYALPPRLLKEFQSGTKNPVMVLNEYCVTMEMEYSIIHESPDEKVIGRGFHMASIIDGFKYPQGSGKNKKDAKNMAAKLALEYIINNGLIIADPSRNDRTLYTTFTTQEAPLPSDMHDDHDDDAGGVDPRLPIVTLPLEEIVQDLAMEFDSGLKVNILENGTLNSLDPEMWQEMLRRFMAEYASAKLIERVIGRPPSHYDQICLSVHNLLKDISLESTQVAAFLVKDSTNGLRVVSLGSGSGMLGGVARGGRTMVDSRAVVLARRGLLKFFYDQLNALLANKTSIFCRKKSSRPPIQMQQQASNQFCLREDVSLHLFLSHPPNIDLYPPECCHSSNIICHLEVSQISSTLHHPSFQHSYGELCYVDPPAASIDGSHPVRSVSEADKMLMWNVVGVQGSVLSRFIDPVYLSSVTVGRDFNASFLCRDLCCRLPEDLPLPPLFRLHHPFIGRPSIYGAPYPTISLPPPPYKSARSMNWIVDTPRLEILNPASGIATADSPFKSGKLLSSRLCKLAFFSRYNSLLKLLTGSAGASAGCTYQDLKHEGSYSAAKREVQLWMEEEGLGAWSHKCEVTDCFASAVPAAGAAPKAQANA